MSISIKSSDQIEKMRLAGKLASSVLEMIGEHVITGVTTEKLDQICHNFIVNDLDSVPAPLNYNGFPKSICTSVNNVVCHGIPSEKKLKKSEVLSPTFNIVFEYDIKDFIIEHYDLYRLKNEKEIKNIGLFSNLKQNITIVEWPELIKNKPINRIDLFFEYTKDMNERTLTIKTSGRLKDNEF